MDAAGYLTKLVEMMLAADRQGASLLMEQALSEGLSPETVLHGILDPALYSIGEQWNRSEVSLAQGFVAAKIAEDTLTLCLPPDHSDPARPRKGVILLGNIEDDYHSLGRRMVASFLRTAGWEVVDLGNDVTPEEFLAKAEETGACLIGASAMMQTTAMNILKLRKLIDSRGLAGRIRLAVGGAVFNWRPELITEVGGDGTARNASDADELFTRLQAQVIQGDST
jgi:methylmalonyl-CoA mutase cobalamin-binding domain/chain